MEADELDVELKDQAVGNKQVVKDFEKEKPKDKEKEKEKEKAKEMTKLKETEKERTKEWVNLQKPDIVITKPATPKRKLDEIGKQQQLPIGTSTPKKNKKSPEEMVPIYTCEIKNCEYPAIDTEDIKKHYQMYHKMVKNEDPRSDSTIKYCDYTKGKIAWIQNYRNKTKDNKTA